ncbi:hypothetical protein NCC49_002444 [Naganishia albida]|nr:hypothetical protein NCC49_002444 [Naganishia albida]
MTANIPYQRDDTPDQVDAAGTVESLVPPPSSADQSRDNSQQSITAESSSSSFLLTLKPAKSRTRDPSYEDATTKDEEPRRATPTKRGEGESGEQSRLKAKALTSRKGHAAPPPRAAQSVFTNLVLPHAKVPKAPTSGMYFSHLPSQGYPPPKALRAHTATMVGNLLYLIGGCDKHGCWPGVATFNTETHTWRTLQTGGVELPPLRAHTTTLVGRTLYVFGGGDGPTYSNEVYAFDTQTHTWSKPRITTPQRPPPRRAHTAVHYTHHILIFGGGNGHTALNDVWALDISDPRVLPWAEWPTKGDVPVKKGYHTANLVGGKMVVFGGSDGVHSFADIHVLDIPSMRWTRVRTEVEVQRLSHTSTQVGSYLFIIGGHDGQRYAQDVLLFNLVTLSWETKPIYGVPPAGRGYHTAVLHDSRILISGGYDGHLHFGDLYALELASCAYLPQVTTFEIDEIGKRDNDAIPERVE